MASERYDYVILDSSLCFKENGYDYDTSQFEKELKRLGEEGYRVIEKIQQFDYWLLLLSKVLPTPNRQKKYQRRVES